MYELAHVIMEAEKPQGLQLAPGGSGEPTV